MLRWDPLMVIYILNAWFCDKSYKQNNKSIDL